MDYNPIILDAVPGRATIRDVAAEAGVSVATVSRVLNDSAAVSPETRQLVLRAIEQQRFTGRRKRLRPPQMRGTVALRCPYMLSDYFGLVLSGVARSLQEHGKRLLYSSEPPENAGTGLFELLLAGTTEGAILFLPLEPPEILMELRATGYHFVVIDPSTTLPADVAAVSCDNMAGARAATEHLIDLGHRRIAVITGPAISLATDGRLTGFRAALAEAGQLVPDELIVRAGEPAVRDGLEAARHLLALDEPPTAIVAYSDKVAIGAMKAAAERGLSVPGDLSVVGFDALELGQLVVPRLTTVRQPLEEMARISVELLVRMMEGRAMETLHIELAAELVVGASTGPPRRVGRRTVKAL